MRPDHIVSQLRKFFFEKGKKLVRTKCLQVCQQKGGAKNKGVWIWNFTVTQKCTVGS